MANIIDIDDVVELKNRINRYNRMDLNDCEFWYDGRKIEVPEEELKEWRFTGLNNIDFVLSRDWPDNPKFK